MNLREELSRLDALPAIPSIAHKILSLKIATEEGERALLELIEKDPTILSRIVGLSNSPVFGTSRGIFTLKDAAVLLGSKRIKMVALSFAMMSSMTKKTSGLLDVQDLWQHSLSVAMTMDMLTHLMPLDRRPPDDEIYLAGLLHDIGFLVLDHLDTELSDQFHLRMAAEPERTVAEIEAEMLELNHGELGAALGRHWELPEGIIAVLKYHHMPCDVRAAIGLPLVAVANMAERLLPTFGIAEALSPEVAAEEWRALGIDPAREDEIASKVEECVRVASSITL